MDLLRLLSQLEEISPVSLTMSPPGVTAEMNETRSTSVAVTPRLLMERTASPMSVDSSTPSSRTRELMAMMQELEEIPTTDPVGRRLGLRTVRMPPEPPESSHQLQQQDTLEWEEWDPGSSLLTSPHNNEMP